MKRVAALLAVLAAVVSLVVMPSALSAQQATRSGVSQQAGGDVQTQLDVARLAGFEAGKTQSTTKAAIFAGSTSLLVPGSGLIFLLFTGDDGFRQNPVHQAHLSGKSEAYTRAWYSSYNRTLKAREQKAVLIGTAVGTVVWFVAMKPLMFPKEPAYGGLYY